jgi:hypothetical protein
VPSAAFSLLIGGFRGHHRGLQAGSSAPTTVPGRKRPGWLRDAGPADPWDSYASVYKSQASPSLPPKGENRGPLSGYSCKSGIFRVPQWGAMTSVMAPPTTPSVLRDLGWGAADWWPKASPRCGSTSRV